MTGPEKQSNIIENELKRAIMKRSNDNAGLGNGFCGSPGHEMLKLQKKQWINYQRQDR
jgi:hypothetical protein